jgi:two-component system alkaline phosphatase synthesis response regulator PhoP
VAKETILVVDDEEDIQELLKFNLSKEGYDVLVADSGEKAIELTRSKKPHMVVLDLMLPGMDGLEVCKKIKSDSKTSEIPILMLTAKGEESDIVTGLELGAEDYVVKPFSPKVLIARIRKILRKSTTAGEDKKIVKIHDIVIDIGRHEVSVKNKLVELTYTEFNILLALVRRPGLVLTRYQIVDVVRGSDYPVTDRAVDVQIVSLRRKLGTSGKYIETIRGVGYRFKD